MFLSWAFLLFKLFCKFPKPNSADFSTSAFEWDSDFWTPIMFSVYAYLIAKFVEFIGDRNLESLLNYLESGVMFEIYF